MIYRTILKRLIFLILAVLISFGPVVLYGQNENVLIIEHEKRKSILETGNKLLNLGDPTFLSRVDEVKNPFEPEEPPEVVPLPTQIPGTPKGDVIKKPVVTAPIEIVRLSDEEALARVARSFEPRGSMIVGSRKFLLLEGGTKLRLGDQFSAKINDQSYTVTVESITQGDFTLRLGTATHSGDFLSSQPKGSIQINRPSG